MKYKDFIAKATTEMAKELLKIHFLKGEDVTDKDCEPFFNVCSEAREYALQLASEIEQYWEECDQDGFWDAEEDEDDE